VTLRHRFAQTRLKGSELPNPLTLREVPAYYRERFEVRKLEFWSNHFESLAPSYLRELRQRVKAAGCDLINVQVDADYDLASPDETRRQQSLKTVREWIDAVELLGSHAVRINPGRAGGSVEKCIASMKEVNRYCQSKRLPLLTENHFGIEMDPEVHLKIRREAGPENIYTLPDFGNYPPDTMMASLAKILPHAWLVSAKATEFNEEGRHVSYDFVRCVELCEAAGFRGLYLVEQWSRQPPKQDAEEIADWMLERTRTTLSRIAARK
jgi:sugar phosphate isomerase/epimerase